MNGFIIYVLEIIPSKNIFKIYLFLLHVLRSPEIEVADGCEPLGRRCQDSNLDLLHEPTGALNC